MRIGFCVSLATALAVSAMPPSGAQTPVRGVITNIRSVVTGGGTVEISYDLASPQAGLAFDVSVEASEDGGSSFPVKLSSVTGDVGPAIMPGTSKRVVWNAARDVERAAFDRFQFRITATAVPRVALPASKPSSGAQPTSAAAPSKGGGGMKWVVIGGGVAAAGAAAALAGGGSGSSTPAATSPTLSDVSFTGETAVLLAGANAVTFVVNGASSPQGDALTANWTFGDGTTAAAAIAANGSASTRKIFATAGTFTPRVTISGSRGSTSRDYRTLTVATITGRWTGRFTTIGGNFSLNLSQNGSQITGDSLDDFTTPGSRASSVSGSVSGPPSALRFRLNYPEGGFYEIDVEGSGDQRTFTGTITGRTANPFTMVRQ